MPTMHRVTAPTAPDPTGPFKPDEPGRCYFLRGIAFTDDDALLRYFRDAGYLVEPGEPNDEHAEEVIGHLQALATGTGVRLGTPVRDAAVDPRPADFLPPSNAGKPGPLGNPHGPHVVAPEVRRMTYADRQRAEERALQPVKFSHVNTEN